MMNVKSGVEGERMSSSIKSFAAFNISVFFLGGINTVVFRSITILRQMKPDINVEDI